MLKFLPLDKNVNFLKDYFEISDISFCDLSVGTKFMWRDDFVIDYCVFNDTLILKESCPDYKNAFYFPMGRDINGALSEIEDFCRDNNLPLTFCCIDNKTVPILSERYPFLSVKNDRAWSDYIYDAEAFKSFSGKKYSGQRNHINKFKKLYPNYVFKIISKEDLPDIKTFIDLYERGKVATLWSEIEEQKKVWELVQNMESLNLFGACIKVENSVVAFSVGEIVKDTLIVHVEKGLTDYDGVYPTMANEFAKTFAVNGVRFINREEDCGDLGLRISKLQYHPVEVKEKNFVSVNTAFESIDHDLLLLSDRLSVSEIKPEDKDVYAKLFFDDNLNKFYGYDYREDLGDNTPSPEYAYSFMMGLRDKKEEFSFAVRKDGNMIGEIVLYNFGIKGDVEIGYRFLPDYQGKGFARESVEIMTQYAFKELKVKSIKVRVKKGNERSLNLIEKTKWKKTQENENEIFFEKIREL